MHVLDGEGIMGEIGVGDVLLWVEYRVEDRMNRVGVRGMGGDVDAAKVVDEDKWMVLLEYYKYRIYVYVVLELIIPT